MAYWVAIYDPCVSEWSLGGSEWSLSGPYETAEDAAYQYLNWKRMGFEAMLLRELIGVEE